MSEITSALLQKLAPMTPKAKRDRFLPYFNEILPKYGITTELRVAAFLATVIMESDYLKATEEYASGWAYDITKNRDKAIKLGNTAKGDGPKYKGRTLIQTTGKKNYKKVSDRLGVDFVANPELLADPKWAVEGACIFWDDNGLNTYADKGKFFAIEGIVNRGNAAKQAKDYPKRLNIYDLALRPLPDDFELGTSEEVESIVPEEKTPAENEAEMEIPENEQPKVETPGKFYDESKERVAVVASKPPTFMQRVGAKATAAITGNALFQWVWAQIETIKGIVISPYVWGSLTVIAATITLIWLWNEYKANQAEAVRQKELDMMLLKENSTNDNFIQMIPPDEAEIYRARGYKVITRGQ